MGAVDRNHRLLGRLAAIAALFACWSAAAAIAQSAALTAQLDAYLQGRYDDAVRQAASVADLGPFRLRWVQDAPAWIRADPAAVEVRRAAAAAFLLELTHARLESDWGRFADLIEFTCVDLRHGNPDRSFENAWHRASLALAGRARARLWLLGEYAVLPHQKPRRRPPGSKPDPNPQHLMHALERFPDDPTLQLGRIVAWTWGRDEEPMRNLRLRDDESWPMVRSGSPQREAVVALQPLVEDSTVGAEALVRIAQLQLSLAQPAAALVAAERVGRMTGGNNVRYLAHLLSARALELLNRPAEAAERYTAALELIPGAESATIGLTSLQFARDDRERALETVARLFENRPVLDPWRLVGYGSFMHWPQWRSELRAALPR
jgi:tetratricopeptide (TPR) repeat protein